MASRVFSREVARLLDLADDRLGLEVVLQGIISLLATDTGLLVTTERRVVGVLVVRVHPHGAGLDGVRHLEGLLDVLANDGGTQTKRRVVALEDGIVEVFEADNAHDGSEDLLVVDLVALLHLAKDGGLNEVALVTLARAAAQQLGLILAVLHVAHDGLVLLLGHLGALLGVG